MITSNIGYEYRRRRTPRKACPSFYFQMKVPRLFVLVPADPLPIIFRRYRIDSAPRSGIRSKSASDVSRTSPKVLSPAYSSACLILVGNRTKIVRMSFGCRIKHGGISFRLRLHPISTWQIIDERERRQCNIADSFAQIRQREMTAIPV